ncbi:Sucrase/ferredoxin-like-domain-containing protein [Mycotypha africana]|uniref:Sucrase/ferredoxin-like-domain-containing protein n=1 Tax=Mycotypha africana TaxID=64632 RepID=UPI002301B637|nr:Sucrase/ferredoxin-like-domain-containing protein [Mycotypha africana]KAI8973802.1 Sucrase/ferredoxin-like-domain-containing protein [Mycotypha africana]
MRFMSTLSTFDVPFDSKPFPFTRFEPCCPEAANATAENGFIPCKQHPIPNVLGRKINMTENMVRPPSMRHIVGCVGPEGKEWFRSEVLTVQGSIIREIMLLQKEWMESHRPEFEQFLVVLPTIADRLPLAAKNIQPQDGEQEEPNPDLLLFPEFKLMPSLVPKPDEIRNNKVLYDILETMWNNPKKPIPHQEKLQDISANTVIFVCTHGRRDMRCGKIGPLIVDEFRKVLKEKGLEKEVEVWGTSHFGGHEFAGNLIIHQRGLIKSC